MLALPLDGRGIHLGGEGIAEARRIAFFESGHHVEVEAPDLQRVGEEFVGPRLGRD